MGLNKKVYAIAAISLVWVILGLALPLWFPKNPTQTPDVTSQNVAHIVSKEEAIDIALPYINQYASEYNRKIVNVSASLLNLRNGDIWDVFAHYDRQGVEGEQYWIIGYEVYVALDGTVTMTQAYGVM